MRVGSNQKGVGLVVVLLSLGLFLVLGCKGGAPNLANDGSNSEDGTTPSGDAYLTDPVALAALEQVCQEAKLPARGLSAVITRGSGNTIANYFTGNAASGYTANNPLVNEEGDELVFDYSVIHTPSTVDISDGEGVLIELASEDGDENTVVADGFPFDANFGFLYEGTIRNNGAETRSYYFATRADDAARIEVDEGNGFRQIAGFDGGTSPRLSCPLPADLVTLDAGETLDIRVIWTQGNGGHAMTLLRKEIVDNTPVDLQQEVDDNCNSTTNVGISALEGRGWEIVPEDAFYSADGFIPEGWSDQCFELGYGAF